MSRAAQAWQTLWLAAFAAWLAGPAAAARLDKETCAGMAGELAALTATGLKAEMERGPEWGLARMSAERLQNVRRVLELEDQLEFRCGVRGISKPKVAPAAPPSPSSPSSPTPPDMAPTPAAPAPAVPTPAAPTIDARGAPATVPPTRDALAPSAGDTASPAQTAPARAGAAAGPTVAPAAQPAPQAVTTTNTVPVKPQTAAPAVGAKSSPAVAVAPTATTAPARNSVTAANPPPSVPPLDPNQRSPAGIVSKPTPPAGRLTPPNALGAPALPAAPAEASVDPVPRKPPVAPTAPTARKKNPRRTPSSAYVSPSDVSPYFLPGMR